jgi:hypothetical protein
VNVTSKGLRDLFFLGVGSALLYHEFWQLPSPSPLGVFVALFLFGLIPAFRADAGPTPGPLGLLRTLLDLMTPPPTRSEADREAEANAAILEQEARVERAEQVVREAKARAEVPEATADGEDEAEAPSKSSRPRFRPPGSP